MPLSLSRSMQFRQQKTRNNCKTLEYSPGSDLKKKKRKMLMDPILNGSMNLKMIH
jgi:hypothetical protein